MTRVKSRLLAATAALALTTAIGGARDANAFAYIFTQFGADMVTHAKGYNGTGGNITVSVGIDATSAFATQMQISVANVVNTWNGKTATTGNLDVGGIGFSQVDFESTLLHEVGHSLGLAHVNAATESGLTGNNRNFTKAEVGTNGVLDINAGGDGIIGSADDIRGDDVNLNYFRVTNNNPFATNLGVVDSTTYSRDVADLQGGDTFSANGDRAVAAALGFADTEVVMQQGAFFGETQRSLGADDVAGLLYAQAGLDGIAGTSDDYVVTLDFLGLTGAADILIDFDNSETGFAESQNGGTFLTGDDIAITSSRIFFNTGSNWYFNQESNDIPAPASWPIFGLALAAMVRARRKRTA